MLLGFAENVKLITFDFAETKKLTTKCDPPNNRPFMDN